MTHKDRILFTAIILGVLLEEKSVCCSVMQRSLAKEHHYFENINNFLEFCKSLGDWVKIQGNNLLITDLGIQKAHEMEAIRAAQQ